MFARKLTEDEVRPPSSMPEGRLIDPSRPRSWTEGIFQEGEQVRSEPLCDKFGARVYSGHQAAAVLELNRDSREQALPRRRSLVEQIERGRERERDLLRRARRRGYRGL